MVTITFVYMFCGLLAGMLIGAVGIGGVILVPLLIYLAGGDVHQSVAAAIFSFLVSGIVGTLIYTRRGVIEWPLVKNLTIGAIPGTLAGTFLLFYIDAFFLKIFIALITIASASRELLVLKRPLKKESAFCVSNKQFVLVGFITGALSALSGTGGPLILIPILLLLSAPMLLAVGLSQVIQLPVAIFATLGNAWNGLMDWHMAVSIAFGVAVGSFAGGQVSKRIPVETIKKFVATLLLSSGTLMIVLLFYQA